MKVRVRFFAALREAMGSVQEEHELASGSTVQDLIASLVKAYPALGSRLGSVRAAVNRSYVRGDARLQDGDEVALVPPVGGG
jgi:molybdopterin converting factor subunit 1